LWGANSKGEGVACHFDTIVQALKISLW